MRTITKTVLAVLTLALGLSALQFVKPSVAEAHDGDAHAAEAPSTTDEGTQEPTTAPPTTSPSTPAPSTTAPSSTVLPAPAPAEDPAVEPAGDTTTPSPEADTTAATEATSQARHPAWRRWRCGSGVTACHIALHHQRHGHYLWQNGKGTRGHTWARYKTEARNLRVYLRLVQQAQQQQQLVNRWSGVASCESGGRWNIATGNGYYGGLQFSLSSWRAVGGTGYPHHHSAYEQARRAERLKAIQGLGAWPHCGRYYR